MSLEYCFICDKATGKAGRGDDSLYDEHSGPYCEDCWDETHSKEENDDAE